MTIAMRRKNAAKLDIVPFEESMFNDCVTLLAEAFIENPLHVQAFGDQVMKRNYGFFTVGLKSFRGQRLVALVDNEVVGFIHWVTSDKCQFSKLEKLSSLPSLVTSVGLESTINVGKWLRRWEQCDLVAEHLHLGPIAVKASMRVSGIGAALMNEFCHVADKMGLSGYLETDRPENVDFYERFNFTTIREERILGVNNFFMVRM